MNAHDWLEQNQRYLRALVEVVSATLDRAAQAGKDEGALPEAAEVFRAGEARVSATMAMSAPPALERLASVLGLSPFERRVLLLCASVELLSSIGPRCAAAQGDPRKTYPTFSLVLTLLPDAHWSALSPSSPLRVFRLIEVEDTSLLTSSPLRIDESVLHYLTGVASMDEFLASFVERVVPSGWLAPSHAAVARKIASSWGDRRNSSSPLLIVLSGMEHRAKREIAAAACAELGLGLSSIRGGDIPAAPAERDRLAILWEREARLAGSALLVDCTDIEERSHLHTVRAFAERLEGCVVIASDLPLRFVQPVLHLEVRGLEAKERRAFLWSVFGEDAARLGPELDAVMGQFQIDTDLIQEAVEEVRAALAADDREPAGRREHLLWDAMRALTRGRREELTQRIEPVATWDDLVLPAPQLETLRDIAAQIRQREKVLEGWGFARYGNRGLGISALFSGPSGTGKTMAAEVLANELRLDLYRIDLSQVVSKYIGETEKNLRRVFDAGDEGGAILLFDEADALFGKRSEIKDSHDRYANIEVSYLLQRMEAYRGLAILTTNLKSALDQAFLRRIRFMVHFPFPDMAQRSEIWRRIFPPGAPTEGLDVTKLARLNAAGGNIRNIALNAAFFAADAGEPVRMAHVLRAVRAEYAKLEKPLTPAEIGGWV